MIFGIDLGENYVDVVLVLFAIVIILLFVKLELVANRRYVVWGSVKR